LVVGQSRDGSRKMTNCRCQLWNSQCRLGLCCNIGGTGLYVSRVSEGIICTIMAKYCRLHAISLSKTKISALLPPHAKNRFFHAH